MIFRQVSVVVAHQGGWDEILLVVGPITVIVALLVIVKRRLDSATASRPDGDSALDESPKTY